MDNVDLSEPILTRFDILCTVRDIADPVQVSFSFISMNRMNNKIKFRMN
jgi:DNA replicative helicase MCM subunit Mcm2 (Cdc46/Mcm family)